MVTFKDYEKYRDRCNNVGCNNCPINALGNVCAKIKENIPNQENNDWLLQIISKAKLNIKGIAENGYTIGNENVVNFCTKEKELISRNFNQDGEKVVAIDGDQIFLLNKDIIFDFDKLRRLYNKSFQD